MLMRANLRRNLLVFRTYSAAGSKADERWTRKESYKWFMPVQTRGQVCYTFSI